jgi:hypothetical protein
MHLAGLSLLVGLAACSSDDNGPSSGSITEDNAETIGQAVIANVYASASGFFTYEFNLEGPAFALSGTGSATRGLGRAFFSETSCPSFMPDPFPDADEDGIPDNTTFSFDSATCDQNDENGSVNFSGNVIVSDPGSALGYDLEIDDLSIVFTPTAGDPEAIQWGGDRSLRGGPNSLSLHEAFDFTYFADGSALVRLRTGWDVNFTADEPGSITEVGPLPLGDLSVDGGFNVEGPGEQFLLQVETVSPLQYDPACFDFVGGTLRAYVRDNEGEGAVQVTWGACGTEPSIIFVGQTT